MICEENMQGVAADCGGDDVADRLRDAHSGRTILPAKTVPVG